MSCYCDSHSGSVVEDTIRSTVDALHETVPVSGVPAVVFGSQSHQPDSRQFRRALDDVGFWAQTPTPIVGDTQPRDLDFRPDFIITGGNRGDELAELMALRLEIPLVALDVGPIDDRLHAHSSQATCDWHLESVLDYDSSGDQPSAVSHGRAYPTRNCIIARFTAESNGVALCYWDGNDDGVSSAIDTLRQHDVPTHAYRTPSSELRILSQLSDPTESPC